MLFTLFAILILVVPLSSQQVIASDLGTGSTTNANLEAIRSQVAEALNQAFVAQVVTGEWLTSRDYVPADRTTAGMHPDPTSGHFSFINSLEIVSGAVVVTFGREIAPSIHGSTVTLTPYQHADGEIVWRCGYALPPAGTHQLGTHLGTLAAYIASSIHPQFLPPRCQE